MLNIEGQVLIHKIAKEQGFQNYKLEIMESPRASVSAWFNVKIISEDKSLSLFIKVAPAASEEQLRQTVDMKIYDTEKNVYTELREAFRELEEENKVPEEHRLDIPKYYDSIDTEGEELIILEDIRTRGYTTHDKSVSIDWAYGSSAVTELAKLHALSVAYQENNPKEFEKFLLEKTNDWLNENFIKFCWFGNFQLSLNVVRKENKEKLQKFLDKMDPKTILEMFKPLKLRVMTHGDYRICNMMHRIHEDGSVQVIPVDYQTIQGGCPILDLIYFIFSASDQQFRKKHMKELTDLYYKELSESMRRLGVNPDKIYSKKDFHYELKEKLPFGLAMAAFTVPIITGGVQAPGSDPELAKTNALFPQRMNEIVDDFIEWGILK